MVSGTKTEGRDVQSDDALSCASESFVKNTLSADPAARFSRCVSFCFCSAAAFCSGAKRWSTPGSVGRKKGAFSGCFGGSLGLLRCCKDIRYVRANRSECGRGDAG